MMQRLWKEKKVMKKEIEDYDAYFNKIYDPKNYKFGRTIRRFYDRVEDLPNKS